MRCRQRLIAWISATLTSFAVASEAQAGPLDNLRFKNDMVYGLTDLDQRSCRFCSGNLFGVKDQDNRMILPAIYSDIESCGHGLFLATEVQKRNKYYYGDKRHFFNRDGVESIYALPDGAFLFNIFSFGAEADANSDLILKHLPEGTILHFGYPDCDESRAFAELESRTFAA